MKDLSFESRAKKGKKGGVKKLVFLTAILVPEGARSTVSLPFLTIEVRLPHFPWMAGHKLTSLTRVDECSAEIQKNISSMI